MIYVTQSPKDFQAIMLGTKRQLTIPTEQPYTPLKAGDIIRVGLTDHGTAPPTIDCIVTHTQECVLAHYGLIDEEMTTEPTVIVSIKRGINW